jgi:GTP-binding protein EngB required for normal cell division
MSDYKKIIDEIARINRLSDSPDLTRPVTSLLSDNENRINIAVLGQFKSGKSTLINSIIREKILPVGIIPVTAVITRLRYGRQPRLIIRFNDAREIITELDELPLYVTEKLNPENAREVAFAIVEHPSLREFNGISFIDTPGLGSFYRHNTDTTLHWLPFIGIAIIAISVERPLSEEDIHLITGTYQYCPDVALVITKTDLIKKSELEEIKIYISNTVQQALKKDLPLFEYSVYKDPQVCNRILFDQFIGPLMQDPEKLDEIIRYKIHSVTEQSIRYNELALQAIIRRENEKNLVMKLLDEIKASQHYQQREMLLSTTAFKGEIRDKLEPIIMAYETRVKDKINHLFYDAFKGWKGTLFNVSRTYEQWLKESMGDEITRIGNECFPQVNQVIKDASSYYEYSARQFRRRLDEKVEHLFGAHLPEAAWQIDFAGIDQPDVSIYRAFDSNIDSLLFFLPMKIFKGLFFYHFKNQIPYETEKNLQRYISDLNEKILKSMDSIHQQSLLYINTETKRLEKVLHFEKSNRAEMEANIERLHEIFMLY